MTALLSRGFDAFVLDPSEESMVETLSTASVSACYVALHGKDGEDGTAQRLLDLLEIPYTGTPPHACQVTFDKVLAKEALEAAGVATPGWAAVQASALRDLSAGAILSRVVERVGLPAVVKPNRAGSAMGLTFVELEADLPAAVMGALSFGDAAVIEHKVEGTEVAASMVGAAEDALPLVEVVPKSGVFDYAARYTAGATEYYAPARVTPEVAEACVAEATKAFSTLGLRDVSRADIMVDREGRPFVIDVNVSPGMTDTSLLPMAASAAGVSFPDLCARIVELALARR